MTGIKFKEPESNKYIYIDAQNKVHLLIPLVGGSEIGLDNTCQAKVEIGDFFLQEETSAKKQLQNYKEALLQDIEVLNALDETQSTLLQEKKERLEQIEAYLKVFTAIPKKKYKNFCQDLRDEAGLPIAIQEIIKGSSNAGGISLCPFELDTETSLDTPVFSLKRCFEDESGTLIPYEDGLGVRLDTLFKEKSASGELINKKSVKQTFIERIMERWGPNRAIYHSDSTVMERNFSELKAIILEELVAIDPGVTLEDSVDKQKKPLNLAYVVGAILGDEDSSLDEWVVGIIDCGIDESFWSTQATSIFYENTNNSAEGLKIKLQFLLGEINFHCKIHHLSEMNFGKFFDEEPQATDFTQLVADALGLGDNIEKAVFDYINEHHKQLGLNEPLTEAQQQEIIGKFTRDYHVIKESPHFDEFFIVDLAVPGNIKVHQGRISCHFLDFIQRFNPGYMPEILAHHAEDLQQVATHLNHKNAIVAQGHERVAKEIIDTGKRKSAEIDSKPVTTEVQEELSPNTALETHQEERKQREKLLQDSGFNDRLISLARKAVALRDKGHIKAAKEAETICHNLVNHKEDYLNGGDKAKFLSKCETVISKEHTVALSQSRGFSGVISRIINAIWEALSEKSSSFSKMNKSSMEHIKNMREALNDLKKPAKELEGQQENQCDTTHNGM